MTRLARRIDSVIRAIRGPCPWEAASNAILGGIARGQNGPTPICLVAVEGPAPAIKVCVQQHCAGGGMRTSPSHADMIEGGWQSLTAKTF